MSRKHRIVIKVSEPEADAIIAQCRREDITIANYFRRALRLPLAEQGYMLQDKGKLRVPQSVRKPAAEQKSS